MTIGFFIFGTLPRVRAHSGRLKVWTDIGTAASARLTHEARLQLNQIRREGLRAAKWSRSEQLKSATDPAAREIIQKQLDQITDDLKDVDDERDRLRILSP